MSQLRHESLTPNSHFHPLTGRVGENILKTGGIVAKGERPMEMVNRMLKAVYEVEARWGYSEAETQVEMDKMTQALDGGYCVMGSPVMTNAGRFQQPLSSCYVPSADLRKGLAHVKKDVVDSQASGMGSGFDFSDIEDPVAVLRGLNQMTLDNQASYKHGRSIGNMASITVRHPKLLEFISIKEGADKRGEEWRFNISVNMDDEFMRAAKKGKTIRLTDGTKVNAKTLYNRIVSLAANTGDPGLLFMDRLNEDNPTPNVGMYTSVAPCAEVGLAPGETCQFGYINVGKFIKNGQVDIDGLTNVTEMMTRALDNSLEVNIDNALTPESAAISQLKRKIGIGMYGLADLLAQLHLKYDSDEARRVAQDVMAIINYSSKITSHELAKQRGSFGALNDVIHGSRYDEEPGYLVRKYAKTDTTYVHPSDWVELDGLIKSSRYLRNASTTALPPTGKTALIGGAYSWSIEPYFDHIVAARDENGKVTRLINRVLLQEIRNNVPDAAQRKRIFQQIWTENKLGGGNDVPQMILDSFDTALEISHKGHMAMVGVLQAVNDESVSKTINLPATTTEKEIADIYMEAWELGLKGVTIFRDQSRENQPQDLSES